MKKLAKLSAREEPGVEVGNGEEDLRFDLNSMSNR